MSILNIRPAKRELAKVVVGISGTSGSGKTYTALQIAKGMARGDVSKIALLDTENKRGSLYADMFYPDQFLVGDLEPPFSPARYIEAIKEIEESGAKVLIIDSASHEWEGEGGCEDIANASLLAGKKMADWKKAKYEHKKFVNALLQSNMHIIVCLRAREKTDFKNPNKPVSLGLQPICEKNFMFEMTASLMMFNSGSEQMILKPCEGLPLTGMQKGYMGEATGAALIDWVEGTQQAAAELVDEGKKLMLKCENTAELKAAWTSLAPLVRTKIGADFLKAEQKRVAEPKSVSL